MNCLIKKALYCRSLSNLYQRCLLYSKKRRDSYLSFVDELSLYSSKPNNIKPIRLYLDYKYLNNRYGFSSKQYLGYQFWKHTEYSINKYISDRRRIELFDYADDKDYIHIMGNKHNFYDVYKKYMQNECLFSDGSIKQEEFISFCKRNRGVVIKPINGEQGEGVKRLTVDNDEKANNAWHYFNNGYMQCEKILHNCKEISSFHNKSLNTIRVSTVIDEKANVHIMAATIRVGRGDSCVDNGSAGGIFAAIDVITGIICSYGYDILGNRYLMHPDTKKVFMGTPIPKWKDLQRLVLKICNEVPQLRFIGWDFVLNENYNWILLEGNEPGGVEVHQIPLQKGLYFEYASKIYGNKR